MLLIDLISNMYYWLTCIYYQEFITIITICLQTPLHINFCFILCGVVVKNKTVYAIASKHRESIRYSYGYTELSRSYTPCILHWIPIYPHYKISYISEKQLYVIAIVAKIQETLWKKCSVKFWWLVILHFLSVIS